MAFQGPLRRLGRAFDNGEVPLPHPVPALLELPLRRRGLDQHQQARGIAVEPVDDEDPLVLSPVAEEAGHLEIGGLPLALVGGDGEEAGRFFDHQESLVLVMDADPRRELGRRCGEFPRPHRHPITGPERVIVARLPRVIDQQRLVMEPELGLLPLYMRPRLEDEIEEDEGIARADLDAIKIFGHERTL